MANCTYLLLRSACMSLNPVTLPPGRERLSTSPTPMGLPTLMNTMGIVDTCCFAATDAACPTWYQQLSAALHQLVHRLREFRLVVDPNDIKHDVSILDHAKF